MTDLFTVAYSPSEQYPTDAQLKRARRQQAREKRVCACGTVLSVRNPGPWCFPCTDRIMAETAERRVR